MGRSRWSVLGWVWATSGCHEGRYYPCSGGVVPFDGATHAPLDVEVRLDPLYGASDLAASSELISFTDEDLGVPVPFEVHAREGALWLRPRSPLEPDRTYRVEGLFRDRLTGPWTSDDSPWAQSITPASSTFHTGGIPAVVATFSVDYLDFDLVFSEPMDPDSLRFHAGGEEVEFQLFDDLPQVVRLLEPEGPTIEVADTARSLRGQLLGPVRYQPPARRRPQSSYGSGYEPTAPDLDARGLVEGAPRCTW